MRRVNIADISRKKNEKKPVSFIFEYRCDFWGRQTEGRVRIL